MALLPKQNLKEKYIIQVNITPSTLFVVLSYKYTPDCCLVYIE